MTVSVMSSQVPDLVPIEHESADRLVQTLVFALPPASLAVVAFDRHSELCRLDGLEFFASTKRALARPRAGVAERVRLRWRGAPEGTPSGLSPVPFGLAVMMSLPWRPAACLSLPGGGSLVVGERPSATTRQSTTAEAAGGRPELPTSGRRR